MKRMVKWSGLRFISTKMNIIKKITSRNYFLVIYVKPEDFRVPIFIPFPLGVAEDLIESIIQIYRIACWIKPGIRKKHTIKSKWVVETDRYMDLLTELIREFRKTGRFTFVEVRDGKTYVSIKTY